MPKGLIRSSSGKIPVASQYSCGQIAFLMGCSHRTAARFIDRGYIKGFRLMSSPTVRMRERRVLHASLVAFIKEYPDYRFMLDRLDNYDPKTDFGEGFHRRWPPARFAPSPHRLKTQKKKIEEELDTSGLVSELDDPQTQEPK